MSILTFPEPKQLSLRERARKAIPAGRVATVEARIRLMEMSRIFESAEERRHRLSLEGLRSRDHAVKPWLKRQRVVRRSWRAR